MTSRPRVAAGLSALLALTGALVLGGVTVANAAPNLAFTPGLDGSTQTASTAGFTFSGTTDSLQPVEVFDASEALVCTATPPGDGTWACDPVAIPLGSSSYTAAQLDPVPDPVNALANDTATFTLEPPAPTYDGADPATVTQGADYTVSGTTTYPGATIDVTAPGIDTCSAGPFASSGSPWSCVLSVVEETAVGPAAPAQVTQTVDGVTGAAATFGVTVVAATPFAITAPAQNAQLVWSDEADFPVSGTAPNASLAVSVELDGQPYCLGMLTGTSWTCGNGPWPDPGPHTVTAERNDVTITSSFDVVLPAPGFTPVYTVAPGTTDAVISGTRGYDASTRIRVFEAEGEGFGPEVGFAECPQGAGDSFACEIDLGGLPTGTYIITGVHFLPAQPGVSGTIGEAELRIETPDEVPVLTCAFAPGGVTITPDAPADIQIYTAAPSPTDSGEELAEQGACNGGLGYRDDSASSWVFQAYGGEGGSCASTGCTLSALPPGIYDVYYGAAEGDSESSSSRYDYLFRVPNAPTGTVARSGNSLAMSGTATAGDIVRVVGGSGATLCQTTASAGGVWACGFTASQETSARALSVDPQSGGLSAYSTSRAIPVFVAPTLPTQTPTTPTVVTPTIVKWLLSFDGDLMNLKPGDTFSVTIDGMPEGWTIEVVMHSTPRLLGTATATGAPVTLTLTVPDDIESGAHRIEVAGITPLGTSYFENLEARVLEGAAPATEDETTTDDAGAAGEGSTGGGGGAADRSDPGAPSALSDSLAPLERIVTHPVTVLIAGGLALALLFLVALPTELLNSSLSSNTSRLGRAYGAIDGAMNRAQDWLIGLTRSRAVAAGVVVLIVAIIYGFVDPGFGFDIVSLRLVLSLAIALFALTFVASWISGLIIRRAWGASGVVAIQPSIILFAIVGVIVARILDFSPGFLVGVAIGLELLAASKRVSARAVFVQISVVTGLSLLAWVVYSLFTPGNDFAGMLVQDTLVAITAEGLTGALIAIFPLQFLDGRELWEMSKRLWVIAFVVVATAFALLVLPTAVEGTEVADYGVWLLVFAVFGAVSLAVWFVFARAAKRDEAAEEETVDA